MWYSGLACSRNALATARFCVQSSRTRALPLLGFCAIVPEAPRVDWPVGLGAGGADEARRPTLWRVSGCALDRFHRASRVAFIAAGTRGPGRPQSRLLFRRRHKMAAPRAGLKRALGEGRGLRSGRVAAAVARKESELILSRSSLRAHMHWAGFPEDLRAARDQPSRALRQPPVQLFGITWLGLCSVCGVWCPWEVCCLRDWNS